MTSPITYSCFSCHQAKTDIFAKINRSALQYPICSRDCLAVALQRLGLVNGDDRNFTSPVNITVRNSVSPFVNLTRSPLTRSPGSQTLNTIDEADIEVRSEIDPDNEGLKQIDKLAKTLFKEQQK